LKTLHYQLEFLTPAFMGNAEQEGQWRSPPVKALLRQWWRVAYAHAHGFKVKVEDMRREEGRLLGNAWLDAGERGKVAHSKSLVRIRLDKWDIGRQRGADWPVFQKVVHPEVNRNAVNQPVSSDLYLGYGPLTLGKGSDRVSLKTNAAIQSGETATLSIAMPEAHVSMLEHALWMMDRYGALGGRSRNGWGSLALMPARDTAALDGKPPLRDLGEAILLDWPHALGQDERGALVWATSPRDDWKDLMRELAELKIGLRTQFPFTHGKNAPTPEDRHRLSYPVTNHSVQGWKDLRLPSSLRFKVRKTGEGRLVAVIFHVPCMPPPAFKEKPDAVQRVWAQVHAFLDGRPGISRIGE
jgi:CRISPR-associated protein Cmr1